MKNTRLFGKLAGLLIACAMTVGASAQPVGDWFVDGAAGSDTTNDGESWTQPFETLQKALDEAAAGVSPPYVIFVAAGTYHPDEGPTQTPDDDEATYNIIAGVAVYGGFLNGDNFEDRDPIANETILSGEIGTGAHTDNSEHVVSFVSLSGAAATLDGFTVSDGDNGSQFGAGILVVATDVAIIRNCILRDNVAEVGGGIGVSSGSVGDELEVRNCLFENNSAGEGGGIGGKGTEGDINVINCYFSANSAISGGAVHSLAGPFTFINTTFTENSAFEGGALHFEGGAETLFVNSLFLYNTANDDGS